jgi:hypothetical protein
VLHKKNKKERKKKEREEMLKLNSFSLHFNLKNRENNKSNFSTPPLPLLLCPRHSLNITTGSELRAKLRTAKCQKRVQNKSIQRICQITGRRKKRKIRADLPSNLFALLLSPTLSRSGESNDGLGPKAI